MKGELLSTVLSRFRSTPRYEPPRLTITLEGEADLDAIDALGTVLEATHSEAERLGVEQVVVDITRLAFLNSSGIRHFVVWLRKAAELKEPAGYRIRMLSSAAIPWQRRSLKALSCFASDILSIETVPTS